MNYSWEHHLDQLTAWFADSNPPDAKSPVKLFVLIDAGQSPKLERKITSTAGFGPSAQLFAGTFAHAALPLSPWLLELAPQAQQAREQLEQVSAMCLARPMLSVLGSTSSHPQLLAHLRSLLRITVDGTDYLWRFADAQMFHATMQALDEHQQQLVCGPCLRWWLVDHEARLWQWARHTPGQEAGAMPLVLDDIQERAMLDAAAGPMLASQLRALDARFADHLSHAQQSAFAHACLAQADAQAIDRDEELVAWSLQRWQEQHNAGSSTA